MNMLKNEFEKVCNEWTRLKNQWKKTSDKWNDNTKMHFENELWQNFEHEIPAFIKCFEKTTDSLSEVCQEMGIRI